MCISDWSSDVCSSDLPETLTNSSGGRLPETILAWVDLTRVGVTKSPLCAKSGHLPLSVKKNNYFRLFNSSRYVIALEAPHGDKGRGRHRYPAAGPDLLGKRSEEHTSELQSLMRISYAVFCLKKKYNNKNNAHRLLID